LRRPSRREVVLLVFSVLAIAAFWAISVTINSTPTPPRFEGWIAVLQHGRGSGSEINLTVSPASAGGSGDMPRVVYSVAACGPAPFRGVLLLGEDARLADLQRAEPAPPNSGSDPNRHKVRPEEVRTLRMLDVSTGTELSYRDVQIVRLAIPAVDCVPRVPGELESAFFGAAMVVSGRARGAVETHSHGPLGIWAGPRSTQSWPYLGSLPGIDPRSLGEFQFEQGLAPGAWRRPFRSQFNVDVGALNERATVDFARPTPASATSLSWSQTEPYSAVARVTDEEALGSWKTFLVFATIALGVGASFLAALLLGLLKPSEDRKDQTIASKMESPKSSTRDRLTTLVALVLLVKLVKRRRR
jgi:hypothetical protein